MTWQIALFWTVLGAIVLYGGAWVLGKILPSGTEAEAQDVSTNNQQPKKEGATQ